jgi:hypothetical protein
MMRPFYALFLIYMLFYVTLIFSKPIKDSPLAWILGLGNAISMVAMLIAAAICLARQRDEFQRKLLTQSMIWGIGGMLAITTIWGLLEVHTSIPQMDVMLNFPIFVIITAIAKVTLLRRNPASEE